MTQQRIWESRIKPLRPWCIDLAAGLGLVAFIAAVWILGALARG